MLEIKQHQTQEFLLYALILLQTFNINSNLAYKLSQHFSSYQQLLSCDDEHLKQFSLTAKHIGKLRKPNWQEIEVNLEWLNQNPQFHHIITWQDYRYPKILREIYNPPLVLFIKGNIDVLAQPQIAIVGSRNSSLQGRENAHYLAQELVKENWVITSGLALGIDTHAHQGALEQKGQTIAVMGTGLEHVYPRCNKNLAEDIIDNQGALISECCIYAPPCAKNFPQRNRIISGLSLGVVVVEANLRSGSLITARLAMEQGREVFALPGSIHNPLAKGCHQLIRQGAKLVDSIKDITEELPKIMHNIKNSENQQHISNNEQIIAKDNVKIFVEVKAKFMKPKNNKTPEDRLLRAMNDDIPTPLDVLACRSNLTITEIMSMLTRMELDDKVRKLDSGYIKIIKSNKII